MQFILSDWDRAISGLSQRLVTELSTAKKTLWLTSGGSNIEATARIMAQIPAELSSNLTIMLNDERYGPDGHKDSNWQQLLATGVDFKSARAVPVLRGLGFEETLASWEQDIEDLFKQCQIVVLHLGMGPDGHVSGILPGSPACRADGLATAYEGGGYQRLTMTFSTLKRATATYLFAFGDAKRPQLEKLRDKDLPLSEQPAQILKQLPEAYVYNDQLGGSA